MSRETCARCRYYDGDQSECHRNPPIYLASCGNVFPSNLHSRSWCGEWSISDEAIAADRIAYDALLERHTECYRGTCTIEGEQAQCPYVIPF